MRSKAHRDAAAREEPGERADAQRADRHPRRRTLLIAALAALVATGLLSLFLFVAMRAVRQDLLLGRSAMERGRSELGAGDAGAAAASFREARQLFERAEDGTSSLLVGAVSWLPILGRTGEALDVVAESAVTAADAAIVLADAAADVPGGLAGLAPTGGAFPIELIPPLARAAREADELTTDALARLEAAPTSLLIGPVGPARRDAEEELADLRETVHAASLLLQGLPSFLGADGPQRYLFGAQNPAELRGTGGLIGAYSILRIDAGRFRFSPFAPIHSLGQPLLKSVPPPNEDYAANYDPLRRQGRFWTAINLMPDLPSVGQAILNSYEASTGERLDGVILADPFALEALLEATGPVELRGYDVEIDSANVVSFTTNEAYSVFSDPTRRKRVLGDVARAAFERFVGQTNADLEDLRHLLEAAGERHIQVFSEDPVMQEGLRATPVGGTLRPAGAEGDLLSVVVNSAAGSKVDFYQERKIRYSVALRDGGLAATNFELTLRNHAPTSGQPPYVIGPFQPDEDTRVGPILQTLEAGESVALVNVYCGTDCIPGQARMDEAAITVDTGIDLGIRFLQHYFSIRSGEQESLQLAWEDPNAWAGNSSGGVYRMSFANQITIRPTELSIRIAPPTGMRILSASAPLQIVDGAAVYEGIPGPRLDIQIEFAPPTPVAWWRNVTRFLTTPLSRI